MKRRSFMLDLGMGLGGLAWLGVAGRAGEALSRFKLGITSDEVSQDFEAALKLVREFDLRWVEIRNLWGRYVTELSIEDVKRAKGLLDKYGVKLSVLDTSFYKCALPGTKPLGNNKDDYPYQEQEALLKRAIERSEILDSHYIRVFSFWRVADREAAMARVIEHLEKAVALAKALDRVLLLENVGGGMIESSAESVELLKAIPSPHFGLAWDPNNAYCAGEVPFPNGYALLDKKRVPHIHLRDARRNPQTGRCQWLPVGKGEIDNLGLLRALLKDKFTGTLTLETHYQRPDKNKELASRESLRGLLEVIGKV